MGARLLIGTRWFRQGEPPQDALRAALHAWSIVGALERQHAELQAGMSALRAVAGAIVLRLGGEARLHR